MSGAGPEPPERAAVTGERRVTADLDDAEPLDIYRAVSVLRSAGCYDIEARVSSGGEGAHVRGWVDAADADEQDVETIRLLAGDDPRRVELDRTHVDKPAQILFTAKPGGEAGPWRSSAFEAADDLRRRSERYGPAGWSR